jgi:iron complex outermembrane recepter protein
MNKKSTAASAFLASLLLAAPLAAQEEDAVVVTATRAPQPSLEIPASVDRLYADEIRLGRPQVNLSESLGRVPGIVVQNRQNYAQDLQISSRGFGARSTFGVRGIRLVADGIPATMPDGQGQAATFALGSAQRIEVLRGPFSSLYGNAAGGVIVVQTGDGPTIPAGEASFALGSYRTWRAALKYGGQWERLNGIAELSRFRTDGYRVHSAAVRDQLNGKLRFALRPETALTLVANSLRQPETQDPLGLTRAQLEQNPRQAVPFAFTFNTRKTVYHEQIGATLEHRFSGASRLQATVYGGDRWVEQYLAFSGVTLTSSGGVVQLDRNFGGGALRYATEQGSFRLSAGLEHEAMDERRRGFVNESGVAGALRRDEDDRATSTDAYLQGEWKLAERWSAHGGVRASRVRFRVRDYFVTADNPDDSGERTYRAVTPVAGIVFRATPRTSVYGNLGRGFETPTFVELAHRSGAAGGLNFELDASRSRHGEVGLKTVVPGRARMNVAAFEVQTRNEIVVDQSSGGRASFKNAGRTERRGVELGVETLLAGPFQLSAAYTRLDAVFRDAFTTVAGTPPAPAVVPGGNRLPGIPRSQLYSELGYGSGPFFARGELLRKSRIAVDDRNTEFADRYSTLNFVFGLRQEGAGWQVSEFVRIDNFTDRNYAGSVIVNDANRRFYEPAPRRSLLLGIQAKLEF